MEIQFLAVHEEGASQLIRRQGEAISVILILQAPRVLLRRLSRPGDPLGDESNRAARPPMRRPSHG